MTSNFDPMGALELAHRHITTQREMIEEAIWLIDCDRPNEAKRHLQSMLEFGVDERMRQEDKGNGG